MENIPNFISFIIFIFKTVASPTSQLILQPFRRFTYVTAHSTILQLIYLRHLAVPALQLLIALRGPMGEISNIYNFSPRFFICGTHIPPIITIHAAKFHSCLLTYFLSFDFLFLEIRTYIQNLSPRTYFKNMI